MYSPFLLPPLRGTGLVPLLGLTSYECLARVGEAPPFLLRGLYQGGENLSTQGGRVSSMNIVLLPLDTLCLIPQASSVRFVQTCQLTVSAGKGTVAFVELPDLTPMIGASLP